LYWAPSQIPGMSTPELNFLTAARSQVRFDIGVRNFRFENSAVDSRMTPVVALQHHDGAFISFPLVSTEALYL
jgi:hypothetical protein